MMAILLLVGIVYDGKVYWYEGLVLFICYFLYFVIMFQNPRMSRFVRKHFDRKVAKSGKYFLIFLVRYINARLVEENGKDPEKMYNRDSVRASVASAFGSYAENTRRSAFENPEEFKRQREALEQNEIQGIHKRKLSERKLKICFLQKVKKAHSEYQKEVG